MTLNMASSEIHKSSLNGKFQWEQRKIWEDMGKFSINGGLRHVTDDTGGDQTMASNDTNHVD